VHLSKFNDRVFDFFDEFYAEITSRIVPLFRPNDEEDRNEDEKAIKKRSKKEPYCIYFLLEAFLEAVQMFD
jgi:hypothetical protein